MNRHARRAFAAASGTILVAGAVLVTAAPASADDYQIDSGTFLWWGVEDNGLEITDADSNFPDLFGSGTEVQGWTSDAFDDFLDELELTDGSEILDASPTPVSHSIVDGGRSTLVASDTLEFASGAVVELTVTLDIEGNYARWTITTAVTGGTAEVRVVGELGSDSDSEYELLSPKTLVSSDGAYGGDPIIGYQLVGAGATFLVADGDDDVSVLFPAGDTVTLVVALEDYDMCGRDAALADMTARAPSLATTFGASFFPLDTRCVTIDQPQSASADAPVDQTLTVTDVSAANAYYAGDILDYYSSEDVFLENVRLFTSGLPAGLSLGYDPATQRLQLTGSAAAGDYQVRIALADVYEYELEGVPQYDYRRPLFATLAIQITAPELAGTDAPDTAPELAATGASGATPAIAALAGLLLLAGGGMLAARRRLS